VRTIRLVLDCVAGDVAARLGGLTLAELASSTLGESARIPRPASVHDLVVFIEAAGGGMQLPTSRPRQAAHQRLVQARRNESH
jgi:hypothetical protein